MFSCLAYTYILKMEAVFLRNVSFTSQKTVSRPRLEDRGCVTNVMRRSVCMCVGSPYRVPLSSISLSGLNELRCFVLGAALICFSLEVAHLTITNRNVNDSSSPERVKNFLFSTSSRLAMGSTQLRIQWEPWALSRV
jgi:hypothetical protein